MKKQYIIPEVLVREVIISTIMAGSSENIGFGGEVTQFECKRSHMWDALNNNDED